MSLAWLLNRTTTPGARNRAGLKVDQAKQLKELGRSVSAGRKSGSQEAAGNTTTGQTPSKWDENGESKRNDSPFSCSGRMKTFARSERFAMYEVCAEASVRRVQGVLNR
jgi:hypothetical protein